MELASRFKSIQADARTIKHYRARVMDAIRKSAVVAIERCAAKHADHPLDLFDDLDWIYDDLEVVEAELSDKFPPDWKVRRSVRGLL